MESDSTKTGRTPREQDRIYTGYCTTRKEIESEREQVASRKLGIAEALSWWKENMEAEKRECEVDIAKRVKFAKSLEGPLKGMGELLDSRWLHNVERNEQI